MLEKFAQEISEYLSSMMGRSIIITDLNGIIIGAPAKERIGTFHPPSVPCIKYKKMSFDDEAAAKMLGVWYPGSTVPLFYNGRVIGTAAIAGEPQLVLQFTMLVKNQIESLLREKINSPLQSSPQKKINELVGAVCSGGGDAEALRAQARGLGIDLDIPRCATAVFFSNFRGLGLDNNPVKISYEQYTDPIADELDSSSMHRRVIEILREVFPDPQDVIASVGRDKFVILSTSDIKGQDEPLGADELEKSGMMVYDRLKTASIETIIGIGHPAQNLYDLPASYKNAWNVVTIAEKLGLPPRAYHYSRFVFEETILSIKSAAPLRYIQKKAAALDAGDDSEELILTFMTYCECFFSKQGAAEKLHLHRNTLTYRLHKIEDLLGLSIKDYRQVSSLYIALLLRRLCGELPAQE